jgi:phosphoribosylformimino-5-aminoimidazole carboxamide ribotide isomerase
MIIPCIDLMEGKVVQLVQGREKALEAEPPLEMLRRFARFPEIQVIDLDAALGRGSNDGLVELLAARAVTRVGGGVRSVQRGERLVRQGASKVIVGTAAFKAHGANAEFLDELRGAIGRERVLIALDSKGGRIVVKGWHEATALAAEEVIPQLEPYCAGFLCTYVDKEGTLEGTDLGWFRRLRTVTNHELTAAGGIASLDEIRELTSLGLHCALGMAIYTGRLGLDDLTRLQAPARSGDPG